MPYPFNTAGLFAVFLLSAGLGLSAFYRHKCESAKAISSRKWMYWMYSAVFGTISVAALIFACVSWALRESSQTWLYLVFFSLLLALSYAVVLAGSRRGSMK